MRPKLLKSLDILCQVADKATWKSIKRLPNQNALEGVPALAGITSRAVHFLRRKSDEVERVSSNTARTSRTGDKSILPPYDFDSKSGGIYA
jgi:hypothetical protein